MKCNHCGIDYEKCTFYHNDGECELAIMNFETELDNLINRYGMTRKYLIEINQELKIMTLVEFDAMEEELDEFDGIHPYAIKGRVV